MLLESIQFEKIQESHLQAMVDSATRESKTFLFDVSSFANASGGFLIYGIKEEARRSSAAWMLLMLTPRFVGWKA